MDFDSLASLAQFVKVGEETALIIEIHLVSREGKYVWFKERHMQEVLVLGHQVLLQHYKKDKKDKYNFTRSGDIRVLYTLKQVPFTQHILVPSSENGNIPSSLPCCGLINVNGKRVIPYQSSYSQGIQYDCYKVLPLRLHMFIDGLELPSNQGVVKIRQSLVPDQHLSLDIASYFKNTLSNDSDEPLAPLPVSHLKRSNKTRRGQKQSLSFKNHQISTKVSKKMTTSGQTTITDSFSGHGQKSGCDQEGTPSSSTDLVESNYSSNIEKSCVNLLSCQDKLSSPPPLPPPLNESNGCHDNSDIEVTPTRAILDEELLTSSQELFDSPLSSQQKCNDTSISPRKRLVPEEWLVNKGPPTLKISKVSYSSQNVKSSSSSSSSSWLSTRRTVFDSTPSSSKREERKIKKPSKLKVASSKKNSTFDVLSKESSSDEKNEVLQIDNADLRALIKATSQRLKELSTNNNEDISTEVPQMSSIEIKGDTIFENDTIALSSEEDEVSDQQPFWRTQCRAGPNRKAAFKKIFSGYNGIEDLPDTVLTKWLKIRKQTLVNILLGKTPSERHTLYRSGRKERTNLQYSVSTVMLSWEQLQCITNGLYQIFCTKSDKYFNYLWLVLFPESVVHLIMDFHELNYDQAEQKMYNYYPDKSETFDEI